MAQERLKSNFKFNVAKCQSMSDYTSASQTNSLRLSTTHPNFGKCSVGKYLGITITDNMVWGQHASEISSKATLTLGFLRRNLAFDPRST